MTEPAITESWVALAAFAQPHGVSGLIKVKSFTEPADDFARHPQLTDEKGTSYTLQITGHAQGMAIVKVEGVSDRSMAELLRGKKIGVVRSALPTLKSAGQFYTDDLIGMQVRQETGHDFGIVTGVVNYGASDILEIKTPSKTELFAFTRATFPRVDVTSRVITIVPPVILNARQNDESA